ncbi:MAG: hypothetical protein WCC10_09160 [Tumebacillaceae bacterium]
MQSFKDTINRIESKIMPINQIDHRFRLENMMFVMEGISLQARLLTSSGEDYSIQCNYSYSEKRIADWIMMDSFGTEYQVVGIVSKTLYYFARKSCVAIFETMGYEVIEG